MKSAAILAASILALSTMLWAADDAVLAPQEATSLKLQAPSLGTEAVTIPHVLSYQGRLTDATGVPVANGDYRVTFKLYAAPEGGSPFWNETQSVTTRDGMFSVLLGSVTSINAAPAASAAYLGMAVEGDAEMSPRLRIAGTASTAELAVGSSPRGGTDADDAWVRIGTDSVLYTIRRLGLVRGGSSNVLYGTYGYTQTIFGSSCTTGAVGANVGNIAIGGGYGNRAWAPFTAVCGGRNNKAGDAATDTSAIVVGGYGNKATDKFAAVIGGQNNTASGLYSTIPGGYGDTCAGDYGMVGGTGARTGAAADYTFAFGENFTTTTPRAVVFYHSGGATKLGVGIQNPTVNADVAGTGRFTGKLQAAAGFKADTAVADSEWATKGYVNTHGGGGSGTVTSVRPGTGIVCTPNPITDTGRVRLDTTYSDARYVNESQANSVTSGMITDAAVAAADLATTGVSAGTYGSATQVSQVTVNNKGQVTGAANVTISGVPPGGSAGGDLTGTYPNPTIAASAVGSAEIINSSISGVDISVPCTLNYSGGGTALHVNVPSAGRGIYVYRQSTGTTSPAIHGQTFSGSGAGVLGEATGDDGASCGVMGHTTPGAYPGVYGWNAATTVLPPEVAAGVAGYSATGPGFYVENAGTNGLHVKRSGTTAIQIDSAGTYGMRLSTCVNNGVRIENTTTAGWSSFYSGDAAGDGFRSFQSASHGYSVGSAGENGLHVTSADSSGVYVAAAGVYGVYANSNNQRGGYFRNNNNSYYALTAWNNTGTGGTVRGMYVQGHGYATGGWQSYLDGGGRGFGLVTPEMEIMTSGTGKLNGGNASIQLDKTFRDAVAADVPLKVIVTPKAMCNGICVTDWSASGFSVAELASGISSANFDWIAIGRLKGYEQRPDAQPIWTDEPPQQDAPGAQDRPVSGE